MTLLKTSNHEGVVVEIDLVGWTPNTSVFVPTLQPAKSAKIIRAAVKEAKPAWRVASKSTYYDGKYGVRIWRTE